MNIAITCEAERAVLVRVLRSYADESLYIGEAFGSARGGFAYEHALPRLRLEAALLRRLANEIDAAEF